MKTFLFIISNMLILFGAIYAFIAATAIVAAMCQGMWTGYEFFVLILFAAIHVFVFIICVEALVADRH